VWLIAGGLWGRKIVIDPYLACVAQAEGHAYCQVLWEDKMKLFFQWCAAVFGFVAAAL